MERSSKGFVISASRQTSPVRDEGGPRGPDVDRLERAVQALASRYAVLLGENAGLQQQLSVRDERITDLERTVRDLNQTRADVAKRIDDLVVQIEQLEGRLHTRAD